VTTHGVMQKHTMSSLSSDRSFVLRFYRVSNGALVCSVTEVATGRRWVVDDGSELERLLRPPGSDSAARKYR